MVYSRPTLQALHMHDVALMKLLWLYDTSLYYRELSAFKPYVYTEEKWQREQQEMHLITKEKLISYTEINISFILNFERKQNCWLESYK